MPEIRARSQYQSVVVWGTDVPAASMTVVVPAAVRLKYAVIVPVVLKVNRAW